MKSIFDRPHVWHTADKIPAFFLQQISLLSYKLAVWFSKICMQFTIFIGGQAFCSQPLSQRLKFDVHIQLFFTHWYAAHMHLQSIFFLLFYIIIIRHVQQANNKMDFKLLQRNISCTETKSKKVISNIIQKVFTSIPIAAMESFPSWMFFPVWQLLLDHEHF